MPRYDRLSVLMQHFQMQVLIAAPGRGNLIVFGAGEAAPEGIEFWPRAAASTLAKQRRLFEANADWGGAANPLIAALPDRLAVDTTADETVALLLQMLMNEAGRRALRLGFGPQSAV